MSSLPRCSDQSCAGAEVGKSYHVEKAIVEFITVVMGIAGILLLATSISPSKELWAIYGIQDHDDWFDRTRKWVHHYTSGLNSAVDINPHRLYGGILFSVLSLAIKSAQQPIDSSHASGT